MYWPHVPLAALGRGPLGPRAFGLFTASVCCAALTTAVAYFAAEQYGARQQPVSNEKIAASLQSRLPRARPDEPATTGSIEPASLARGDEPPRRAAPTLPPEPARAEELRGRAVIIAASWADCDEIEDAEVLRGRSGFLLVRVRCANGTSAYLDEAEIEANRPPAATPPAATAERAADPPAPAMRLSDAETVDACEDNVRLGLPRPASLIRILGSTGVDRAPGDDPVVRFDFSAQNGFGFPLALQAHCVFDDRKLAHLQVSAR